MTVIKVAVFGHYDSRGGTTAMQIPEFTREALTKVIRRYDEEMFGIEAQGANIERTAYGMPAREADKLAHQLVYGGNSVGLQDLIYVAELSMPDTFPWDEIEAGGLDVDETPYWTVLRDAATPGPPTLDWKEDDEAPMTPLGLARSNPVNPEAWLEIVVRTPVKLEILRKPEDDPPDGGPDPDPKHQGYRLPVKPEDEHRFWKEGGSQLEQPVHPDWNDDAFGFILMPDRSIK